MQTLQENTTSQDLDTVLGFSDRFNQLLDHASFESTGRITKVAKYFGVSVSGARRWCKLDRPPRLKDLNAMVEALLSLAPGQIDVNEVCNWLLFGAGEPLAQTQTSSRNKTDNRNRHLDKNRLNSMSNHRVMSQVYVAINQKAKQMDIDLYNNKELVDDKLDAVVIRLIDYVQDKGVEAEDLSSHDEFMKLTESLLNVALLSYL